MNVSRSKVRPLAFLAVVALGAILISAVIAVDADAARGARGGGGSATLTASPNPAPYGTTDFVISGTGFKPNAQVQVGVLGWWSHMVTTDSAGSFSYVESHETQFGPYEVRAMQPKGNNWVLVASTMIYMCDPAQCP